MELNFNTLTKILSKKTNELLDEFVEYIDCSLDNYSIIDIVHEFDKYNGGDRHKLITLLSKDLKGYDVAYDDEDDLTDEGYDFLILYTQQRIINEHRREYNLAVFGKERGTIDF